MTRQEASFLEQEGPCTAFCYPDDEITHEPDRSRDIRAVEFAMTLLSSCRTDRSRHMTTSICLSILRGNLNRAEVARHFKVGKEQVRRCEKAILRLERWRLGQ